MSADNKEIARRFYEEMFNQGNLAAADELLAADCVDHNPPSGDFPPGREGVRQVVAMFRAAFPDLAITVEEQVAEGDRVVNRLTGAGTHQGELMGVPPTGRRVSIGVIDILRFERGQIVERWGQADMLGMMQQLGLISQPG